jgi:actin-related protein
MDLLFIELCHEQSNYLRDAGQSRLGISQLVYSSLNSTDFDIRTQLLGAVMVCGGTSLFRGFYERAQKELSLFLPDRVCPLFCSEYQCDHNHS